MTNGGSTSAKGKATAHAQNANANDVPSELVDVQYVNAVVVNSRSPSVG